MSIEDPTYYPLSVSIVPHNVVWCRWPVTGDPGGFKDRPALVRSVRTRGDRRAIEVAYGTSKIGKTFIGSFYVANLNDMNAAGLYQATRFELPLTTLLPFAEEFFPKRPDGSGPVIGKLSDQCIANLQRLLRILDKAR